MKFPTGIIVFAIAFLISGVVMHQALYDQPGLFVWSYSKDSETGESRIARTVVLPEIEEERQFAGRAGEEKADPAASDSAPAEEAVVEETTSEPVAHEAPEVAAEEAAAEDAAEEDSPVVTLFDGKDLGKWKKTQFGGEGDVFVNEDGNLEFGFGAVMTGVHWDEDPPATSNYEIRLEAMKLDGHDFFCALTFPVKDSHATFVIGGWGGGVVGISSVDDLNASENETMNIEGFEDDRWYAIRVRVTDERLEAWIDDSQMVDLALKDRKISLLPGDIELSVPIGIASFQTRAQYRGISWENLAADEESQ